MQNSTLGNVMDNFVTVILRKKAAAPLICWKLDADYRELEQEYYFAVPGYEIIIGRNVSNGIDYCMAMTKLSIISCDGSLRHGLCRVCGNGGSNIVHYSKTVNGFEHINICIVCFSNLKTIDIIETANGKMCIRNDCMCFIYTNEPDMIYQYSKKVIPGVWYPSLLIFRTKCTYPTECMLCSYTYEESEYNICIACANMQKLVFLYDNTIKYMLIKEITQKEEGKLADLFDNFMQSFLLGSSAYD
jgi:hypothetical protein